MPESYAGLLHLDRGLITPVLGTDMGSINRAIVARWSIAGLKRVKALAWRIAAEREGVLELAR